MLSRSYFNILLQLKWSSDLIFLEERMILSERDYIEAHIKYKDKHTNPYEHERYHALLLLSDGYSAGEVADILRVPESTIWNWIRRYREEGLGGLKHPQGWGGERERGQLNKEQRDELDKFLTTNAAPGGKVGSGWTLKQIIQVVKDKFGLGYSRSGMKKVLKKMGWSFQRSRAKYIKPNPKDEEEFEKKTQETLAGYAESGKRVVPVAEDEAKLRLESTIGYRWNPKGQQPEIEDGGRRGSISLYGTVHLGTGEEFTIQTDWQDSEWTIQFLEEFQKVHPEEQGDILLFWDGASYHTSGAVKDYLEEHPQIVTIPFAPRSPETNPKESTWKTMREDVTHNHWHDSLADLVDTVCDYYQNATKKVSHFLEKFGFIWKDGRIHPLPVT
jgi:transposase